MSKTPKLRFKEFSGDWESKRLGELGEFRKTYSFSRNVEGEGNYKHIHYGDIHMNYKGIISKDKLIPSIDIPNNDHYEFIKERDIIFADASEDRKDLGKIAVVRNIEGKILSGLHTFCFRPKESLNGEFFLNHSLNKEYLKFIYTRGNGAKVLGISKSNLSEYKFLAPSIEEQDKIASFFSLIDDKISLQDEKVEALKDYKKGMMQKIFSRELRFKDDDGRDYPEWEEKKIKEMELYISDGNYGEAYPTSSDMVEEGVPFLRGNNINNGYLNFNDMKYITPEKHSELLSGHIKSEDIIITVRGDIGKVGFATCEYEGANMNAQLALIRVKCKKIDARYLHQYMNTAEFYKEVLKRQTGTALKQLPIGKLKDISLKLPNIEEQRKISLILCGLDSKLEKEQEKLDSLNKYKKGLLQQMFV
ncbi:restriction endonuclease subunit S [Romboutsia sp. 1001216sp1]|uniref:restriction endonuclease subunit S n=1 Tax=unclassified Romboutsia TaxID=2626894 RepID=UPI00189D46C6|nr:MULTISPECIES: restriction endonuclease subunit S [unclassified Romboutsia]MDB8803481.1 restriction endonuclease subunit S [Romboutsia sp. 1001216sp1]MDB8814861.1 restriction endonuclease subunit S [Romboutsia sp. 1001216sp1]